MPWQKTITENLKGEYSPRFTKTEFYNNDLMFSCRGEYSQRQTGNGNSNENILRWIQSWIFSNALFMSTLMTDIAKDWTRYLDFSNDEFLMNENNLRQNWRRIFSDNYNYNEGVRIFSINAKENILRWFPIKTWRKFEWEYSRTTCKGELSPMNSKPGLYLSQLTQRRIFSNDELSRPGANLNENILRQLAKENFLQWI